MSAKEPKDPFDLSQMPDQENLDLGSPSKGADMDLPELEPFAEASAENIPELPELPDQVELKPNRASSTPPIDDLPSLPSDVLAAPVKQPSAPKPAAKAPAPKKVAPPVAKPSAVSKPAPVKPVVPKAVVPKAAAPKPKPVVKQPVAQKPKPVQKPIEKVAPIPAAPIAAAVSNEVEAKASADVEPVKATIEPTTPTADTGAAAPAAPGQAGEREREPDLAPIHLRKASWIVLLGSLLPWMGSGAGWVTFVAAKLTICLGAWILFQTVRHGAGETVPGLISKLAAIRWAKPDSGQRNKPMSEVLLGKIPSLGHLIGLVALLGGVAVTLFDPAYDKASGSLLKGLAEVGMLAWAAGTMVHIFAFTHGGKFNPIFPLMFIGMVFAGLLSLIGAFLIDDTLVMASSVLGSLAVASGGVFACYTIFEAMKQAKVEGEAKKAAAREARQAARKQSGGGGKQTVGKPVIAPKKSAPKDSDKS